VTTTHTSKVIEIGKDAAISIQNPARAFITSSVLYVRVQVVSFVLHNNVLVVSEMSWEASSKTTLHVALVFDKLNFCTYIVCMTLMMPRHVYT
jgi:hypothetical protein